MGGVRRWRGGGLGGAINLRGGSLRGWGAVRNLEGGPEGVLEARGGGGLGGGV